MGTLNELIIYYCKLILAALRLGMRRVDQGMADLLRHLTVLCKVVKDTKQSTNQYLTITIT